MAKHARVWSVDDRLAEISASGDLPETLNATVDLKRFRPILDRPVGSRRSPKGGRPSLNVRPKFRMLVLQSLHGFSLEATERMVREWLSWMLFWALGIADTVADANTLWDFREALIKAGALEALFQEPDRAINQAGFIPRAGQILARASSPRQRNCDGEKAAIKAGKTASEIWPDKPAKAAQKDTHARWSEEGPQTPWGVVCPMNTSSAPKRIAWAWSSERPVWPAPRRQSRWQTWSTIWGDCGGVSAEMRPPYLKQGKNPP